MQEALARNKEEAQILAWLENHVVTDVAYEQTERIVWTALWDDARKMSKEEVSEHSFLALISLERRKHLKFYGRTDWDYGNERF